MIISETTALVAIACLSAVVVALLAAWIVTYRAVKQRVLVGTHAVSTVEDAQQRLEEALETVDDSAVEPTNHAVEEAEQRKLLIKAANSDTGRDPRVTQYLSPFVKRENPNQDPLE